MKITIPDTPKSLNQLFAMHSMVRYKYSKETKEMVGWIAQQYKLDKKFPVKIKFTITFDKIRRRDVDNYLGGCKYWIDGLVAGGLLPDDCTEYVKAVSVELKVGKKTETTIEI